MPPGEVAAVAACPRLTLWSCHQGLSFCLIDLSFNKLTLTFTRTWVLKFLLHRSRTCTTQTMLGQTHLGLVLFQWQFNGMANMLQFRPKLPKQRFWVCGLPVSVSFSSHLSSAGFCFQTSMAASAGTKHWAAPFCCFYSKASAQVSPFIPLPVIIPPSHGNLYPGWMKAAPQGGDTA